MARAKKVSSKRRRKVSAPKTDIDDLVAYCDEGKPMEISDNFLDYTFLLYGESGSGKTSTLSKAPGAYIVQCDPKRKGLRVRQTNIPDVSLEEMQKNKSDHTPWDVVEATFNKIIEDDSVQTVVIDNMRLFYQHASNHYCKKHFVQTLNEMNDFGVSWDAVDAMYLDWFSRIVNSGRGLGIITHQREREIQLPDDTTLIQIQPDVSGRPFQALRAITDFAFYLGFNSNGDRVLTIRHPGNDIWYKCCTDEDEPRFFSPEGTPVHRISAGNSPGECWANILKSWNNELHDVDYTPKKKTRRRKKAK